MYLIAGLGNPGEDYEKTRHNIGFIFADKIAEGEAFRLEKKWEAKVLQKKDFLLVKPMTYMNDSGRAIRKVADYYQVEAENVVVVHDDLDIAFGEYKIQKEKGPKVHNGLKSVEQNLGETHFWRVRVGIDNRQPGLSYGTGADYVLSKFSKDELKELGPVISEAVKELAETLGLNIK